MIIAAIDATNMFLDNARLLEQLIRNVELVELTGCDHWAQYERSEEFNRLAGQFLAHHERRTDGDVRSADLHHAGPGAA
jgi:2-hydroxy-6-oxonona-2,4-dienedioate hydrolase